MSDPAGALNVPASRAGLDLAANAGLGLDLAANTAAAGTPHVEQPTAPAEPAPLRRRRRLSCHSDSMDAELAEVVSFRGCRELLRASRLSVVMRCACAIFADRPGSAETYSMSERVEAIDAFLSHNWAVSRMRKFLCLALHFKLGLAVAAAIATLAVVSLLTSLGVRVLVIQVPVNGFDPSMGVIECGCGCTLFVAPVFLLVAGFGHEVQRLLGLRGCTVFLDKTCVHQVDMAMQQVGIRKLGAFLRSSRRMVVVYTDLYLQRLWTVYEVACFLSLRPAADLILVPAFQPLVVFGGVAILYVAVLVETVLISFGVRVVFATALAIFLSLSAAALLFRRWAQEKAAIRRRVAEFQLTRCGCHREDDRLILYKNIEVLMRAIGAVDNGATSSAALDALDGIIRKHLSTSLTTSIGTVGLSYMQIVALPLCVITPYRVDLLLGRHSDAAEWFTRYRVFQASVAVSYAFGFAPLILALLSMCSSCCLQLRGCIEWVFLGLCALLTIILANGLEAYLIYIEQAAVLPGPHRDWSFAGHTALCFMSILLAIVVFNCGHRRQDLDQSGWFAEGDAAPAGRTVSPALVGVGMAAKAAEVAAEVAAEMVANEKEELGQEKQCARI